MKVLILVRELEDRLPQLIERLIRGIRHPDGYSTVDIVEADTPSAKNQMKRARQSPHDVIAVCGSLTRGSWNRFIEPGQTVLTLDMVGGRDAFGLSGERVESVEMALERLRSIVTPSL
jgi:hypothetical protein